MRFYVSDAKFRPAGDILHVTKWCATFRRGGTQAKEADLPAIEQARTLCGICVPRETGRIG